MPTGRWFITVDELFEIDQDGKIYRPDRPSPTRAIYELDDLEAAQDICEALNLYTGDGRYPAEPKFRVVAADKISRGKLLQRRSYIRKITRQAGEPDSHKAHRRDYAYCGDAWNLHDRPEIQQSNRNCMATNNNTEASVGTDHSPSPKRKRGRPSDTDRIKDKKIFDAWASKQHAGYDDLAKAFDISTREVRLALDRHRKREKRRTK